MGRGSRGREREGTSWLEGLVMAMRVGDWCLVPALAEKERGRRREETKILGGFEMTFMSLSLSLSLKRFVALNPKSLNAGCRFTSIAEGLTLGETACRLAWPFLCAKIDPPITDVSQEISPLPPRSRFFWVTCASHKQDRVSLRLGSGRLLFSSPLSASLRRRRRSLPFPTRHERPYHALYSIWGTLNIIEIIFKNPKYRPNLIHSV